MDVKRCLEYHMSLQLPAVLEEDLTVLLAVPDQENGSDPPPSNGARQSDERLPHQQWAGRSTQFMQSNDHRREREGVWNTEGLEGAALDLVKGDEDSGRSEPFTLPLLPQKGQYVPHQ